MMTGAKLAYMGSKYWKEILYVLIGLSVIIFMIFFSSRIEQPKNDYSLDGEAQVSGLVERYRSTITKYAKQYKIESYVEILMAKMMQESGGRGGDPMQASESLGLPPNSLNDPEKSIDVGVKYFAGLIKRTKGDVKLALQSYNFGGGFIDYALKRGGYSKEVAVQFANEQAKKLGWSSYGDVNYVDNVLRYLGGFAGGGTNEFGFGKPLSIDLVITSKFGYRSDPFTGVLTGHMGLDLSCNKKNIPVYATKGGTVVKSGWQDPSNPGVGYGQRVQIDHGNGQQTVYAHLHSLGVKLGQKVSQGQAVGTCGTTGSSTGIHLHYEILSKGKKIDPEPYIK